MNAIKVAVVEDDSSVREILGQWLRQSKKFACVGEFANGRDALAELPKLKPQIVLMDINLPEVNGIECVRNLKLQMPDTQFLMLTIYADSTHIFEALAAGACGYMLKKLRRNALYEAIEEVYAGGSPMTSIIARKVVDSFKTEQPMHTQEDAQLSPRQHEVLNLLTRGYLYKEIAEALQISQFTVNGHIRQIYEKLHVRSRAEIVARMVNHQLNSGFDAPLAAGK